MVQAPLAWNRQADASDQINVTVLDSYVRGVPDWLSRLSTADGLKLVEHDIRQPLPEDIGHFEYVIHAAGIASPTYYRQFPIETMDANVMGLRLLLDRAVEAHARDRGTDGFLFFSSSEIYGDPPPDQIPTPETYRGNVSCTGPRACYDESKRYGETLCVNFARQHGVPVTIARPFNNYGPGLKLTDRRVIPDLARDVLEGRDLTLLRTARQRGRSATSPTPSAATTKSSSTAGPESPTTSAPKSLRSLSGSSRTGSPPWRVITSGTTGKPSTARVMKPTTSSTIRRGAVPSSPKRGTSWATVRQ